MIKGKTLIELTDAKTGKVKRYEDENIITEAAELYISAVASLLSISDLNSASSKRFPIMKAAFGGIKLFENSIDENAAKWQLPKLSVSKIVGYASSDTTAGTDPSRGSANLLETTILENGVQLVWDFATSEANGNISCVCLTSAYGGEYGQNLKKTAEYSYSTTALGYIIGYDKENDVWILISKNSGSVKVRKVKICLNNLKFDDPFCIPTLVEESQASITFGGAYSNALRVIDSNTLCYINTYSKTKVILEYYNMETGSKETTITIQNSEMSFCSTLGAGLIKQGYLYIQNSTLNGIYKINLTNTSDITFYDMPEASLSSVIAELPNGDLVSGNTVFDTETGDYQTKAGAFTNCGEIIEKDGFLIMFDRSNPLNFYIKANELMLMSINNLDTPVTKTADKTMKITYTLTYIN